MHKNEVQIKVNIPMFEDHFHTLIYVTKLSNQIFILIRIKTYRFIKIEYFITIINWIEKCTYQSHNNK